MFPEVLYSQSHNEVHGGTFKVPIHLATSKIVGIMW